MMEHWLNMDRGALRKMAERRRSLIAHMLKIQKTRPLIPAEQQALNQCVDRHARLVRFLLAVTSADTLLTCIRVKARNHKNGGKTQTS